LVCLRPGSIAHITKAFDKIAESVIGKFLDLRMACLSNDIALFVAQSPILFLAGYSHSASPLPVGVQNPPGLATVSS
jgi:hypothetical protein